MLATKENAKGKKGDDNVKEDNKYGIIGLALAAVFLVSIWTAPGVCGDEKTAAKGPSLYERVGGVNNIAVLVEDVIDRSYADPVLHANPRIAEAHKRYPKPAYKFNATALACEVFGGPQKYTGRTLKDAHQHLKINEKEWNALIAIFRESMKSYKVPQKEQDEVIGILESTKGDIVVSSASQ